MRVNAGASGLGSKRVAVGKSSVRRIAPISKAVSAGVFPIYCIYCTLQPPWPKRQNRELLAYALSDGGAYLACLPGSITAPVAKAKSSKPTATKRPIDSDSSSRAMIPAAAWLNFDKLAASSRSGSIGLRHRSIPICPSLPPLGFAMTDQAPPGLLGSVAHVQAPLWASHRIRITPVQSTIDPSGAVLVIVGRGDGSLHIARIAVDEAFQLRESSNERISTKERWVMLNADDAAARRQGLSATVPLPSYHLRVARACGLSEDTPLPAGAWPPDGFVEQLSQNVVVPRLRRSVSEVASKKPSTRAASFGRVSIGRSSKGTAAKSSKTSGVKRRRVKRNNSSSEESAEDSSSSSNNEEEFDFSATSSGSSIEQDIESAQVGDEMEQLERDGAQVAVETLVADDRDDNILYAL